MKCEICKGETQVEVSDKRWNDGDEIPLCVFCRIAPWEDTLHAQSKEVVMFQLHNDTIQHINKVTNIMLSELKLSSS
jgi:hypothetical protein